MYDALNRLGQDFEEVKLDGSSPYVKPASVFYTMDGALRTAHFTVRATHSKYYYMHMCLSASCCMRVCVCVFLQGSAGGGMSWVPWRQWALSCTTHSCR